MADKNPLIPFQKDGRPLIIDGGLATELEARGYDLSGGLWSARLLVDEPEAIRQVHLDYLNAGADCIISASYQGTVEGFRRQGISQDEAIQLLELSVQLAIDARDAFWRDPHKRIGRLKPLVAASIGPYGAYLADGSEFTGDYGLSADELYRFHKERWHILAETKADILACETIPSALEARVLARLLEETRDCFAWFSFSCRDEKHINDGTPIGEIARTLVGIERVAAIGINCTHPKYISGLVGEVAKETEKPIIVYPNSGEIYDAASQRWTGVRDSLDFAEASKLWYARGATLIGGCCRTGPEHIRQVRESLVGHR